MRVEGRPRWRHLFRHIAAADPATPMTGVPTTDPKRRLWPLAELATAGAPGLYVHSPDHDWSRWTVFDLAGVARALALVDRAIAHGASKTGVWAGLAGAARLADAGSLGDLLRIEAGIAPLRGSPELIVATLIA